MGISDQAAARYAQEAHCLGVLLRLPDLAYRVDRALQERGLSRLSLEDFESADHRALLRFIEESLEQDHAEPQHYVFNSLTLPLMDLVDGLLANTEKLDPNEERVLDDLVRTILELRRRHLHQNIEYLQFLMEEAQESGNRSANDYQQSMMQHIVTLRTLDKALGQYTDRAV